MSLLLPLYCVQVMPCIIIIIILLTTYQQQPSLSLSLHTSSTAVSSSSPYLTTFPLLPSPHHHESPRCMWGAFLRHTYSVAWLGSENFRITFASAPLDNNYIKYINACSQCRFSRFFVSCNFQLGCLSSSHAGSHTRFPRARAPFSAMHRC